MFSQFIFFSLAFNLNHDKGQLRHEAQPSYTISSTVKDESIKTGNAKVVFTITNELGIVKKKKIIKFSADGDKKVFTTNNVGAYSLNLKAGKHKFELYLDGSHYEIKTDSINFESQTKTGIKIFFENATIHQTCRKPVIYLYNDSILNANVNLNFIGNLTFSYPQYNNGWNVTVNTDGTISIDKKNYNYLFWEGETDLSSTDMSEGFMVGKNDVISFLEGKLTAMGFNAREQTDFITYWAPQMMNNEKCLVHFMFNNEYSNYALLTISPKPESILRMFMVWKPITGLYSVKLHEQHIPAISRKGFTVVEWGGAEMTETGN